MWITKNKPDEFHSQTEAVRTEGCAQPWGTDRDMLRRVKIRGLTFRPYMPLQWNKNKTLCCWMKALHVVRPQKHVEVQHSLRCCCCRGRGKLPASQPGWLGRNHQRTTENTYFYLLHLQTSDFKECDLTDRMTGLTKQSSVKIEWCQACFTFVFLSEALDDI